MSQNERSHSKSGAVVRIVVWTLVLCLLGGIFAVCLAGSVLSHAFRFHIVLNPFNDSDFTAGPTEISSRIHTLNIDWISGSVTIIPGDGDELTIRETTTKGGAVAEKDQLLWKLDDDTLTIHQGKSRIFFNKSLPSKDLVIVVPSAWYTDAPLHKINVDTVSASLEVRDLTTDELRVDNISGTINLHGVTADLMNLDTVSGKVTVKAGTVTTLDIDSTSGSVDVTLVAPADKVDVETISGHVTFTGAAEQIDVDSTSARIDLAVTGAPRKISAESVSGKITVSLPSDIPGFTAGMDASSSHIHVSGFQCTVSDQLYVFGDGSTRLTLESVSGQLNLQSLEPVEQPLLTEAPDVTPEEPTETAEPADGTTDSTDTTEAAEAVAA